MLAKLYRAGELTPIWIPDAAHEAMRDLVRARHGRRGRSSRGEQEACRCWRALLSVRTAALAHHRSLLASGSRSCRRTTSTASGMPRRRNRLTRQIEELMPRQSMAPVVAALQAMRGVALMVEAALHHHPIGNPLSPQTLGLNAYGLQ